MESSLMYSHDHILNQKNLVYIATPHFINSYLSTVSPIYL